MNTESKPMDKWSDINWRKLERVVYKLQKRIYRASQRGDVKDRHCHDEKSRTDGSYSRVVSIIPEDYRWENDLLVTC